MHVVWMQWTLWHGFPSEGNSKIHGQESQQPVGTNGGTDTWRGVWRWCVVKVFKKWQKQDYQYHGIILQIEALNEQLQSMETTLAEILQQKKFEIEPVKKKVGNLSPESLPPQGSVQWSYSLKFPGFARLRLWMSSFSPWRQHWLIFYRVWNWAIGE